MSGHRSPQPLTGGDRPGEQLPLAEEGATRRQTDQGNAAQCHGESGGGQALGGAVQFADGVVTGMLLDDADRQKQSGLGEAVGQGQQDQSAHRKLARRTRWQCLQQGKEQEQVAQLGNRGIGREQFEPFRLQRAPRPPQHRAGAQYTQQIGGSRCHSVREHLQPQAQHEVERRLDHQRRKHRADRGWRTPVCRRQPEMQREQRGLQQQAGGHHCQCRPCHGSRLDDARQRGHIQRPVAGIDQADPGQKHHRTQQSHQQVAQGRLDRGAPAPEGGQCHRAQAEEFQRDVQVEQVAGQQQGVQRGPQQQP